MIDKEHIVKILYKYGKSRYVEALGNFEKQEDFLRRLGEIATHYTEKRLSMLEGSVTSFSSLLIELGKKCSFTSFTRRLKDVDSLIVKIITKAFDKEKNYKAVPDFLNLTSNNYYKWITDLVGFRILTRFPQELETIDACLRGDESLNGCVTDDPDKYVNDWENDYSDKTSEDPFIVERPKWYHLAPDEATPLFSINDKISKKIAARFNPVPSKQGYRSIHYLINFHGTYVELQLRTLAIEAWSECEHETIYKSTLPDGHEKDLLNIYSLLSANLTGVNLTVMEKVFEIVNAKHSLDSKKEDFYARMRKDLYSIMMALLYTTGNLMERVKEYEGTPEYPPGYGGLSWHSSGTFPYGVTEDPVTVIQMDADMDSLRAGDFINII